MSEKDGTIECVRTDLEIMKQMREERKAEYQRAFEEHRRQMDLLRKEEDGDGSENSGSDDDQDEEWEGIAEPPPVDYEAEYIDEDKYTTVTVEEMDPSREGLLRYENDGESDQGSEQEEGKHTHQTAETDTGPKAAATTKRPKNADKPKKKKKKFRYESREDRKLSHAKQRLSKSKKAKARRDK